MKIDMSYGSGGVQTSKLINDLFLKYFGNEILNKLEDAAVIKTSKNIAFTTDSFVVRPLFFNGGNIGKLAVCGTVNDILMMGAIPKYLTIGFIIEEGLKIQTLEKIIKSISIAAKEAGVKIVAGDTKVIEGNGGIYINTSGIGEIQIEDVSIKNSQNDDVIILSGNLGEHHASIMSSRMGIKNSIKSDCAPLNSIIKNLIKSKIKVKTMRDVTRGGLATVLNEISSSSNCGVQIFEEQLPISDNVKGFCEILGLDVLYMANEGKMIAVVPKNQAQLALNAIKKSKYGKNACIIGHINQKNSVSMITKIKGERIINALYGEGLPRIC